MTRGRPPMPEEKQLALVNGYMQICELVRRGKLVKKVRALVHLCQTEGVSLATLYLEVNKYMAKLQRARRKAEVLKP